MDTGVALLRLISMLAPFATHVIVTGQIAPALVRTTTEMPCGGEYVGTEGTIASPGYPNFYPDNADCQWTVTAADNTAITVNFESFYTYNSNDYLEIRDGNSSDGPLLVTLYGEVTNFDEIISTGNSLFFNFKTDDGYIRKGFKLNWLSGAYCYHCDNSPDSSVYDPTCGQDTYHGKTAHAHPYDTCYTNVHYDGSHRIERGYTENTQEDGTCYDSGFSITCFCKQNHCNNNLCQNCTTTPPPISSTQPPATTFQPLTSSQVPTPTEPLECYSCVDCYSIQEDTNIEASKEFLSCFVAIEHIGDVRLVIRGGSPDFIEDGICRHEADGLITCYCTSNRCNSQ